jgi:hypothetical protein
VKTNQQIVDWSVKIDREDKDADEVLHHQPVTLMVLIFGGWVRTAGYEID